MTEARFRARVPDVEWFQRVIPCQFTCPAHTDVPRYIKLISEGRYDEAYLVNQQANTFPEIIGRICARPCEPACRRGSIDRPVAICHLKRSAGDHKPTADLLRRSVPKIDENGKRIAVVGAGPSGLTAAQDLRKRGYQVTIYDGYPVAGGMLVGGIPAWRLPRDVVRREIDDYFGLLGVSFRLNTHVGRDVSLDNLLDQHEAVYLAAGTQRPQRLDIRGEELDLVYPGLRFMERVNLDPEPPPIGRRVAVIGGGFTAMDCSRSAIRMGADKVYILYRRTKAEMPVDDYEVRDAEDEGVEFQYLISPVAVVDDGHGKTGGLICRRNRLGEPDASGRRKPVPVENSDFRLDVDTVIAATGQSSELSWLSPDVFGAPIGNRLSVDPRTWMSSVPRLFAGGDFVAGARNVISAIADGHFAAAAIDRYLTNRSEPAKQPRLTHLVPYIMPGSYTELSRTPMPAVEPRRRWGPDQTPNWNLTQEVETGYTRDLADREAQRCLQCHRNVTIDPSMCVLCSRCVEYCPYDCIKLVPFSALEDAGGVDELARRQFGLTLDSLRSTGGNADDPFQAGQAFVFDEDFCIRCGICEAVCPTGALQIKLFELVEVSA